MDYEVRVERTDVMYICKWRSEWVSRLYIKHLGFLLVQRSGIIAIQYVCAYCVFFVLSCLYMDIVRVYALVRSGTIVPYSPTSQFKSFIQRANTF
jgi:hypothetical protein